MSFPPLHVITDDAVLDHSSFPARAAAVLEAGGAALTLHLRGPRTSGRGLFSLAISLVAHARATGARLVVNDRVDVARAADAHGVQLGTRSLDIADARAAWPAPWIGRSVHSPAEAEEAARAGTDFVVLGTIYATPSHPGRPGDGPAHVRATAERVNVPVVAIGGITPGHVAEVAAAGAAGVAVLSAVWHAGEPADAVAGLLETWNRDVRGKTGR